MTAFMPALIAATGFVVTFLLVWSVAEQCRRNAVKRGIVEKIEDRAGHDYPAYAEAERPRLGGLLNFLGGIGRRIAGEKTPAYTLLRTRFLQAGLRNPIAVPAFWGVKLLLMCLLPLCFFMCKLALFGMIDHWRTLAGCCALGLAGLYCPDAWLRLRKTSRASRIARALPDALDMMVVCVEAGLGLDAAISRVADEIRLTWRELSDELRLYTLEVRAGSGRPEAFKNLIRRTELEEIRNLANLLIQTDRFGTSLAQGLRVYSESFRAKRFMRAEEKAATLPTKLMLPVLFCIFPALFVVIALPAAMRIYQAFIVPAGQ